MLCVCFVKNEEKLIVTVYLFPVFSCCVNRPIKLVIMLQNPYVMFRHSHNNNVIISAVLIFLTVSGDVITGSTVIAGPLASSAHPTTAPTPLFAPPTAHLPLFPPSTAHLPLFPAQSAHLPLFPGETNLGFTGSAWAEWSTWSTCSSTCRPGESHARTRGCLDNNGNTLKDLSPCIAAQVINRKSDKMTSYELH